MDCSMPGFPVRYQAPGTYSNSCPSSRWCHPTILSSVVPFSSRLQSFPASGSFPMNRFFTSGGQSVGVSASASVLPVNIQDWFPLGLTGWSPCSRRDSQEYSPIPQFKNMFKINYNSIINKSWKKESTWALLGHLLGICVIFPSNFLFSKVVVPFYTLILTNTWYHQHL